MQNFYLLYYTFFLITVTYLCLRKTLKGFYSLNCGIATYTSGKHLNTSSTTAHTVTRWINSPFYMCVSCLTQKLAGLNVDGKVLNILLKRENIINDTFSASSCSSASHRDDIWHFNATCTVKQPHRKQKEASTKKTNSFLYYMNLWEMFICQLTGLWLCVTAS